MYRRRQHASRREIQAPPVIVESEPETMSTQPSIPGNYSDPELPIALRKDSRKCVNYPLSNYASTQKLSPAFSTLTSHLSSITIPKGRQDVMLVPEWREALLEELRALEKNDTWEVIQLPKRKKTVGCKWIFTVKYKADGTLDRNKTRLVAKGFTQTYGIDYLETFEHVAKLNTIRVLMLLAANLDWPLH